MHKKNNIYNMRPSYDGLHDLISDISKEYNTKQYSLIEIGAYSGQSTVYFSKYFHTVITIDPFINDYDIKDPTCKYAKLTEVYNTFQANIAKENNIIHIRETSDSAILNINKYLINKPPVLLIYIDGLHTYDQVKKDIMNYSPLVVSNGYICGHDYHKNAWPEVCKAIDDYKIPDKIFTDTSWLIKHYA